MANSSAGRSGARLLKQEDITMFMEKKQLFR
jgi:phage terminase small subunit